MQNILRLHEDDNVGVALSELALGTAAAGVVLEQSIPKGHKIAIDDIAAGEFVRKYAQIIGIARQRIKKGDHVHGHNLAMTPPRQDLVFSCDAAATPAAAKPSFFDGYLRADGQAATRNYIGILTSVNCSATVAKAISRHFDGVSAAYPGVDGVVALTHGSGCCMGGDGQGLRLLRRTMGGFARHPNFFAILIVGLGCEGNQISEFLDVENLGAMARIKTLTIQDQGGTAATVRRGIEIIEAFLDAARDVRRQTLPASHLKLALQCGGSDAFSGITANPALGAAVDLLVSNGGTAILSETPEIYGAHHLLVRRARTPQVGEKLIRLLTGWEDHVALFGGEMDNNPTPGNKAGGLTTILEKSLGAAAKGGTTNLNDVIDYAEPATASGLVFMDSPGYDPISVTGQVASGANIIAFTTGRGSVFGLNPAPGLKLSTTTALYDRMSEDMDINCGGIIDGDYSIPEMGQMIFDEILRVASGKKTKSEQLGFGEMEFNPWIRGPAM